MKRLILLSVLLLVAVGGLSSFGYSEDSGILGEEGFGGPSNSVSGGGISVGFLQRGEFLA